ncbi:aspartate racemase [Rhodobium orientis]|uniref:Aspartate racemase n=1 Tax=Rhodobium orientis TaxID=34017 RepID=A0A327JD50_9HYPH|nr:amino acid racemase [Rhodobium orientis]MBB4301667.1 aspartate racemase [Rhodobium orientis]MBK5952362.1 hypothetical protein [Rhodobium orientis]RAI24142.1 hypothetical protein CH339_22650 [Rhodobium orientis]
MPRRLGILGGMGPEATVLFMSRILEATPATDDADHIPLLVDSNTQVPSRIRHLIEKTGTDPTPVLVAMAERLAAGGAEALAMPCNTAHSYLPAILSSVSVPFFDMAGLTAARVAAIAAPGPIGILASPAVEITGVLARALQKENREAVYPDDRGSLLAAIRAVKAGHRDEALPALIAACDDLVARGATAAIVGCTEFSLIGRRIDHALPLTDSLDVLTEACVAFALDDPQKNTTGARP